MCSREVLLHDDARTHRCRVELFVGAVYLLPIVHGVHQDLADKEIGSKLAEAVHRHRQNHEIGEVNNVVRRAGLGTERQHLDDELDALDVARS